MSKLTEAKRKVIEESIVKMSTELSNLYCRLVHCDQTEVDRALRDIVCEAHYANSKVFQSEPGRRLIGAGMVEVQP